MNQTDALSSLKDRVRDVPDFPKPGIMFKDITPLLADADAFALTMQLLRQHTTELAYDAIIGIESRGFIFAAALAAQLNKGFVPVRKPGKLPAATIRQQYALEYGSDAVEMHTDALRPGARVLVVDDVLATGGTARATCDLVEQQGSRVAGTLFVIELTALNGRAQLAHLPTLSLIKY